MIPHTRVAGIPVALVKSVYTKSICIYQIRPDPVCSVPKAHWNWSLRHIHHFTADVNRSKIYQGNIILPMDFGGRSFSCHKCVSNKQLLIFTGSHRHSSLTHRWWPWALMVSSQAIWEKWLLHTIAVFWMLLGWVLLVFDCPHYSCLRDTVLEVPK